MGNISDGLAASSGASLIGYHSSSGRTVEQQLDMLYFGIANIMDPQFAGGATIGAAAGANDLAIQAALNAKRFVFVPDGSFPFNQLTIPDNTTLIGGGASSVLTTTSGLDSIVATGTAGTRKKNIAIKSLSITRTGGDGHHAKFTFVDDLLLENVIFTGGRSSTGAPITSGGYASYVFLKGTRRAITQRCQFLGNASHGMDSSDTLGTGTWGEDNRVIDCYMTGAAQGFEANHQNNFRYKNTVARANLNSLYACGFLVYGGSNGGVYESCTSSGHTRDGFYVEGSGAYLSNDITYENCAGYDCGEGGLYGSANFKGITVNGGNYNNNRAVFNDGTGVTGFGLRFDGSSEVIVNGATVRNNAGHGIYYYTSAYFFTCTNNTIRDNAGWAVGFNGTPQKMRINGNRFRGNAAGEVTGFTFAGDNEWDGAPYQAFTPTWTSSGGATAIGNGVLSGRYVKKGNAVSVELILDWGSTTTSAAGYWEFTPPVSVVSTTGAQGVGSAYMLDSGVINAIGASHIIPGTGLMRVTSAAGAFIGPSAPFAWTTGDRLMVSLTYHVA